jgi:Cft2 family RNA processing exonuclease
MQVIFVGGASGVGASCLAIQLAEQWIVVDAGVRVDRKSDPLPDLSLLEGKDIRAIFVTHAHADHIGALPLLHQAFPTAPIYASRGTALLMEVMLADALKVMTRRAVEEMELPLYPESLVAGMLTLVRPLPVGEPVTLSVLPGVTIHASRAGHIAGAVSLGFAASDGSIVVSGDISSTPQRTVIGAVPPPMDRCDLLVLESTYGARLHPNRQAEEARLAQAVANGLAQGGHTLIPCFGLGRGQELLLILQAAQEKGQVPEFPIYVDGLVRRVCSTYLLIPEALSPTLQRQIRKGYTPFTGRNVTFVRDGQDRERILAGPPACILSSSGMLTGGPSAWYAARLASDPNASILITGYQDEESPGKRLLDLAEKKENTLELDGKQVEARCQVAKYSLSAHADGGELAAYAAALKPRRVALVHGDPEARAALRGLLADTDVVLPMEGMTVEKHEKHAGRSSRAASTGLAPIRPANAGAINWAPTAGRKEPARPVDALPQGIGHGVPFDYTHVEQLWHAVTQIPTLRIVTARELALAWYGEVTEETTQDILDVFEQDYEQRYFVRQHALEEAYRVRGQFEEVPGDFLSDLVGSVFLLLVAPGSAKPVICRGIEPGAAVRVQLPRGISQERTRFPFSSILESLGPAPQDAQESNQKASVYLANLVKTMRRIRRTVSAHSLAQSCREEMLYTLGDLCEMAGLSPQSLEDRLALAKLLYQHPRIFTQQRSVFEGEGLTLYCLSPEWREALEEPEELERPDQNWILSVIEQYLGTPADLYRRSIDPDTGDVVLAFHFPARASTLYAEAIAAAAEETGVSITIAPQAHQGELARAARRALPQGLTVRGTPSLYLDRSVVSLNCTGQASAEEITESQSSFYEETGWYLELQGVIISTVGAPESAQEPRETASTPWPSQEIRQPAMNQHEAIQLAQKLLSNLPGFYKAGAEPASATLLLRFHFPTVAQARYTELFAQLEAQTGWYARLYPAVHHGALVEMARRLLPEELTCNGTPSLHLDRQTVRVHCLGNTSAGAIQEAQQRFLEETGWRLELLMPGQKPDTPQRLSSDEALALAREKFNTVPGFYRVGADPAKGTLWLHFHFPDTARPRYMEQLVALATQTGWRVYLYPNAHERALIAQTSRLFPDGVSITGKPLVHQDTRRLYVSFTGHLSAEAIEDIQRKFTEETGWQLDLQVPIQSS